MSMEDENQVPEEHDGESIESKPGFKDDRNRKGTPYENWETSLDEEEKSNPVIHKFLVSEINRLKNENDRLKSIESRYFEIKEQNAVYVEKLQTSTLHEILYSACLAFGAASFSLAKLVWNESGLGWMFLIFGSLLMAGALITKFIKWKK